MKRAPATKIEIVVGNGCATACQMIASLALHQDRVAVASSTGVEDLLDGDELGVIRLPRSGIEVTFPTVAYGTPWGGTVLRTHGVGGDLVTEAIVRERASPNARRSRRGIARRACSVRQDDRVAVPALRQPTN